MSIFSKMNVRSKSKESLTYAAEAAMRKPSQMLKGRPGVASQIMSNVGRLKSRPYLSALRGRGRGRH